MKRVSPTTVIACLALFFSLGGVGLAASGGPGSRYGATASSGSFNDAVLIYGGHRYQLEAACAVVRLGSADQVRVVTVSRDQWHVVDCQVPGAKPLR